MSRKKNFLRAGIFFLILIIQLAVMVIAGSQKKDYHIDEIYSYIISNSYDSDRISNNASYWGTWFSGESLNEFVTVQDGEAFSYTVPYKNTSTDCHPPMFYWALHTVCSFFPNQFSKWFGLSVNIFCFVIAQIFLYLISGELIKNRWLVFLPMIIYGFSPAAIDTCTFIRMYMMLTMFALIFAYANLRLLRHNKFKIGWAAAAWAAIYCGAMTQYYFLIYSFWSVLFICIYYLKKQKYKSLFAYGIGAVVSVALMFLSFPYAVGQATGTSTNNVGNEVTRNLLNLKLWAVQCVSLAKQMVKSISYYYLISYALVFVGLIVLVGAIILSKKKNRKELPNGYIFFLLASAAMTAISVAFIGGEYVYLRYVYFIMPLVYIAALSLAVHYLQPFAKIQNLFSLLFIVFSIANAAFGTISGSSSYLFTDTAQDVDALKFYKNYPLIMITEEKETAIPTGNLTRMEQFDSVYMDTRSNIEEDGIIQECMAADGACVIYIPTDTYWISGYDPEELLSEMDITKNASYEVIANGCLGEFYLISK